MMLRRVFGICLLVLHHAAAFSFLGGGAAPQLRFRHTALPALAPSRARTSSSSSALGLTAQIKFADAVEAVLKKSFKSKKMRRVIDSWKRMDRDELYSNYIEDLGTTQECNSYIQGLKVKTFWDPYEYEWARKLRDNAKIIQDEFQRVAIEGSSELDEKGNNVWVTAANSTSAQVPAIEAFFARMLPESKINAHSDYCNFALTSHLGLDIPEGQCSITVGQDTREWRNGEMLMFDTSLMHAAENNAARMRYILMLRVWHPDLAPEEVGGIRYIFNALEEPEIVHPPPNLFNSSYPF